MRIKDTTARPKFSAPIPLMQIGTADTSIHLMRGQLRFFREAGFEVSLVSSPGPLLYSIAEDEGVQAYAVPMVREISGLSDVVSLWTLYRLIRRIRPAITNAGTPKAGLLGNIAAYFNRVPCRIYTLRGLRCETSVGMKRFCLILAERLACRCSHRVICVSESLRSTAIALGIAEPHKFVVLASGSSNGVDVERFAPSPERLREAASLRNRLQIPAGAPVIGFVGRLVRDKGISELINAFLQLRNQRTDLHLLLVGDFEEGDPVAPNVRKVIEDDPQIIRTGTVPDVAPYYHLMDVLALPTYREGFPNAVLEAHAAARSVVTTHTTGAMDAVQDGLTGVLVPARDTGSLAAALSRMIQHPEAAQRMGRAGHKRVQEKFRQHLVWKAMEEVFLSLLQEKCLPIPQSADTDAVAPLDSPVKLVSG